MRHTRVIWTVLFGLVLTAVVCQGQASVTLSPTSLTFAGQLPLLAQPPRHNRTHGTTHATNLAADDCSLQFQGSARKAVKLRTKDSGKDYKKVSNGDAISVSDWLKMTCSLDGDVPSQIPATKAMPGIETQTVTLDGFLVAAKFEATADHDIHAEIAESPKWETPHVVVEVPPGPAYCDARKKLWSLVKAELPANSTSTIHVMETPPKVRITGYVFLDSAHGSTKFCKTSGGRGIHHNGTQQVIGLWEVHPVLEVSNE